MGGHQKNPLFVIERFPFLYWRILPILYYIRAAFLSLLYWKSLQNRAAVRLSGHAKVFDHKRIVIKSLIKRDAAKRFMKNPGALRRTDVIS